MNTFKYLKIAICLFLLFIFLYTFNINFNLNAGFNIINFVIVIIVFCTWVLFGYLFIIKDIINASENEKNGLVLLMVLLAIIFFYYNPFPNPENSYLYLPRYIYFILTFFVFCSVCIMFFKEKSFLFILAVTIPITIQSFLINILKITTYSNLTYWVIIFLVAIVYFINYNQNKK